MVQMHGLSMNNKDGCFSLVIWSQELSFAFFFFFLLIFHKREPKYASKRRHLPAKQSNVHVTVKPFSQLLTFITYPCHPVLIIDQSVWNAFKTGPETSSVIIFSHFYILVSLLWGREAKQTQQCWQTVKCKLWKTVFGNKHWAYNCQPVWIDTLKFRIYYQQNKHAIVR